MKRWHDDTAIIAKLRTEVFYSFEDLKGAVTRKLYEFNYERFQKREGTRYEAYLDEKESLHALPATPYEIATWVYGRKVNIDYHVVFEYNRYSCPYQYARKSVDLKVTAPWRFTAALFGRLPITVSLPGGKTSILPMQKICQISSDSLRGMNTRIKNWARSIGRYTGETIDRIFENVSIKAQGYNPALASLLSLFAALSLTACAGNKANDRTEETQSQSSSSDSTEAATEENSVPDSAISEQETQSGEAEAAGSAGNGILLYILLPGRTVMQILFLRPV